ncbi:MAG: hypothetical protein HY000_06715 [Planctomycetes bacterium]|nr:hypothetical protein [Planctomycetota bacterium]
MFTRRSFAMISDLLFDHKARRRRAPKRRALVEPLEDRRMLATVVDGYSTNDEPRFLIGDDRLTGEKTFTAGGLTYSSAAMPHPIITVDAAFDTLAEIETLTSFDVELRLLNPGGTDAVGYRNNLPASGLTNEDPLRFAVQVDATGLSTGNYDWEMTVTSHFYDRADTEDEVPRPALPGEQADRQRRIRRWLVAEFP